MPRACLISSIESDDPVIFFEPKRLYRGPFDGDPEHVPPWRDQPEADVPDGYYRTPLGQAADRAGGRRSDDRHLGHDGACRGVRRSSEAELDAELIDLRTLVPLDLATIVASVEKTGRCIVVHEAPRTCGFGAEIVALVQQHCFWSLEAPVLRVTGWDTPLPHAQEWQYMPSRERIAARDANCACGLSVEWKFTSCNPSFSSCPIWAKASSKRRSLPGTCSPAKRCRVDQPLVDVMTDKATVTIPSGLVGRVRLARTAKSARRSPSAPSW